MSLTTEKRPKAPAILTPSDAAARMTISTAALVAIIRKGRYRFTELSPGGKPGDRGRNRWGLTEAQFTAIVAGQERGYRPPEEPTDAPARSPVSPDGIDRLRRGKIRARPQ